MRKRPASLVAAIFLWLIALAQLLRVLFPVDVRAGDVKGERSGLHRSGGVGSLAVARAERVELLIPRSRRPCPRSPPSRLPHPDATEPVWNGYLLTVACPCGVVFERWVTPEEADAGLLRLAALN